jgi:U4/U6 small nuclear ribonucleoprotein PRP31
VLTPYEYALTVKTLGNDLDVMKKDLSFIPNHNIMAINIISSTTSGKLLNQNDLNKLNSACDQIIKLNKERILILDYISTRMNLIAPNVCALVGSNVAAKIITAAGGIIELAKMPASNILVLGAKRQNLAGFSTAGKLHLGYLAEIEDIKKTSDDFKRQAIRRFSNKIALAARIDAFRRPSDIKSPNESNISSDIKMQSEKNEKKNNQQLINHNNINIDRGKKIS